jgi:hypothetical protein
MVVGKVGKKSKNFFSVVTLFQFLSSHTHSIGDQRASKIEKKSVSVNTEKSEVKNLRDILIQ